MINMQDGLTFDDVLLRPKYSMIGSRSEIDLSVELCKGFKFSSPLVPSNMKTITGKAMALKIYELGGLGLLHRFMTPEEKIETLTSLKKSKSDIFNYVGMSIGVKESDRKELHEFIKLGVRIVCIDVAHLDNVNALEMVSYVSKEYPDVLLVAGNVATGDAAIRAWKAGVDVLRIGIGGGSICSTRLVSANGVAMISSIAECKKEKDYFEKINHKQIFIISDGGCSKPADVCKSLCYADMTMIGNMMAGTDETPGDIIEQDGLMFKNYSGSSTYKINRVEGVQALVPYRGKVEHVYTKIHEGLQSCCSYQGVRNLVDLKKDPQFMRVTHNGLIEGGNHHLDKIL